MPTRKDIDSEPLDSEIRVRLPKTLRDAAVRKAARLEYPSDLSAVVRVLLRRWVAGRRGGGRRKAG